MKQKTLIEIPPYYIDTLVQPTVYGMHEDDVEEKRKRVHTVEVFCFDIAKV
jgi:hypothetical protein